MKFVVDAHLPRKLCGMLASHGHEAIHTLDLSAGNATSDEVINRLSLEDFRVVISKDTDFFFSHTLYGRPWKLLLVRTGNISVSDLCALLERNMRAMMQQAVAMHFTQPVHELREHIAQKALTERAAMRADVLLERAAARSA